MQLQFPGLFLASASFWIDQFTNGLTIGSIYALIALGYTMVYGVLQMINFAHGEVFMLGAFGGYFALVWLGGSDLSGGRIAVGIVAARGAAVVVSCSAAVLIERIAYRPVRNAPRLAALISAIGVSIFLQYLALDLTSAQARFYPRIFPSGGVSLGALDLSYIQMFLIGSSLVMMGVLFWIVKFTSLGRAIRAVAESSQNASLVGINPNRTIVAVFVLGAAMAGVAAVLYGLFFVSIRGTMGFLPGIKAFTAAVLGGIGSIPGAVLGGYILGLAETVGREGINQLPGVTLTNEWRDVIAFTLLVLILLFRPTGIMGQRAGRRA